MLGRLSIQCTPLQDVLSHQQETVFPAVCMHDAAEQVTHCAVVCQHHPDATPIQCVAIPRTHAAVLRTYTGFLRMYE